VVANGDVMTDLDVAALVDAHRSFGAEATLHLIGVDDPSAFGVVDLADGGSIESIRREARTRHRAEQSDQRRDLCFRTVRARSDPARRAVSVERTRSREIVADGRPVRLADRRLLDRRGRT
jgi:mannose-1-phosphate guanylyltransferase